MDQVMSVVQGLLGQWGAAPQVLLWVGVLRLVFKPTFTYLKVVVDATPSKKDDSYLEFIIDSKIYKSVSWTLDFLGSIKLPKRKD